jgi:CspA family cold shock protein
MERFTGKVKWFNNKTGYGFIETGSEELFVHHTGLTSDTQYKYLVQGEYVEYSKGAYGGQDRIVAVDVTGIQRGKLMCETRALQKPPQPYVPRTSQKKQDDNA